MRFGNRGSRALAAPALAGLVFSFAASAAAPSVETRSAVVLDEDDAVVVALVHPQALATTVQVEYGPTAAYGQASAPVPVAAGGSPVALEIPITGLAAGQRHHFRVVASNADGASDGDDRQFVAAPAGWTVLGHWTMGDDDAAAANGVAIPEGHRLGDSAGGNDLLVDFPFGTIASAGSFDDQVAALAGARGSRLAAKLYFDGTGAAWARGAGYAVADNFVLEAWCRRQSATATWIHNGYPGYSIFFDDDQAGYRYGDDLPQIAALPPDAGAWLHLALVRDNGNLVLYIDGRPQNAPVAAAGITPESDLLLTGDGAIDELRFSTFAPGTFDPSQLLHRAADLRIEQPAGTPLPDGGVRDFGTVAIAGAASLDFLVRNDGDLPLGGIDASIVGAAAGEFSISTAPPATLAADAGAPLRIAFQPASGGMRTATLRILGDDPDSPYEIALSGIGDAPEIAVETGEGAMASGSTYDFGTLDTAAQASVTFVVRNLGNLPLDGLAYTLEDVPPGEFEITQSSTAPIAPGQSADLTVRFAPTRTGSQTAHLVIASDDDDEGTYSIALGGSVAPPELDIEEVQRGRALASGARRDFGSVAPGAAADYTIRLHNHGTGTLRDLQAVIGGPHFGAFQIASALPATLAPGASTDLVLRFAPFLGGRHDAQLQLQSNDPDEAAFVLDLIGEGGVPQLRLESPAGTPLSGDPAAFGEAEIGGSAVTRSFALRNLGGADLVLTGTPRVRIDGPQAGDFAVIQQPAASVPHGRLELPGYGFENKAYVEGEWHYDETGTEWEFSPRSGVARHGSPWYVNPPPQGQQAAFLQVSNGNGTLAQDISLPAAGDYVLRFAAVRRGSGFFPPPDVAVTLGGVAIGTVSASQLNVDDTWRWFELPFTVGDATSASLRFTASCPWLDCGAAIDAVSIAHGNTAAFDIAFAAGARGTHSATLAIENDAGGTVSQDLAGTGGAADLVLEQPAGNALANGASRDLGVVALGGTATMQFRLRNTGAFPLQLLATFDGSPAFALAAPLPPTVASGAEVPIDVRFAPGARGAHQATLRLASNDPDDSPFDLVLAGTGTDAEIGVSGAGGPVPDGGSLDFGSVEVAASATLVLTIENTGDAPLTGLAVGFDGDDAAAYGVDTAPPATLAAGADTAIVVRFAPSRAGAHAATLRLASNDADENPFDLALAGIALAPEIALEQPAGTPLASGAARDYGTVSGGEHATLDFTVRNPGQMPLALAATLEGGDAAQFALATPPPATLAPGGSAVFQVRFAPTGNGARATLLRLASNDADENPIDIALSGTAQTLPAADVSLLASDGAPIVEPGTGTVYVITVRNLGPTTVTGVRIVDVLPPALGNVIWFCNSAPAGKCPAAQGSGDIDQTIVAPLASNHSVSYIAGGEIAGNAAGQVLVNTATATLTDPNVRDPDLANNTATDTTAIDFIRIFAGGFENQ